MPHFRKKPVVIEAWPVRDLIRDFSGDLSGGTWANLPPQVANAYEVGNIIIFADGLHIQTLEGIMEAKRDDVLICGVKGELYPCKPDIFEATYEPA